MSRERRLAASLAILILITLGGAVGFMVLESAGFSDSLFMTVLTISTVGFREVFPLDASGRILTTALIVVGVGAALYTAGTALEIGLERFLGGDHGRRRVMRDIDSLDQHVILAGFGQVGAHTWDALQREGIPAAIIEKDPVAAEEATAAGGLVVHGDATRNEALDAAGIDRARALIACVRQDSDNLVIVLSAKHRRSDLPVIARATEPEAREKLTLAGADRVVSPQLVGGHRLAALASRPRLDEFVDVILHGKLTEMRIEGCEVAPHSPIAGTMLRDADIRSRSGAQVLAIEMPTGDMQFNPTPETVIRPGHMLIALGSNDQIDRLREVLQA